MDIDPAFLKPEDFCDARNGGGQKYQVKKAEVERMIDFAEKKKKLKNEVKVEAVKVEAVKVEALKLEEGKKKHYQAGRPPWPGTNDRRSS